MRDSRGNVVYRYGVDTDKGHKITWAASEEAARKKLESRGLHVISIRLESGEESARRLGFPI